MKNGILDTLKLSLQDDVFELIPQEQDITSV